MKQIVQRGFGWLRRGRWLGLLGGLLAVAAFCVWSDRHGLEANYLAHVDERPVMVRTDARLEVDHGLAWNAFHYRDLFEVRWSGWLEIDRAGLHRFEIDSSGPARLEIDGRRVLSAAPGRERNRGRAKLEPGLHRVELSFEHRGPEPEFRLSMLAPDGRWAAIASRQLFDDRPGPIRRLVRATVGGLNIVGRNLVATLLAVLALLVFRLAAGEARASGEPRGRLAAASSSLGRWAADPRRRAWLETGGLALLASVAAFAIFPRTGSPFGWDDVRYLDIAAWNKKVGWVVNRYAHVYLLDFFAWLARGDVFLGARLFWSAQFGVIVAALAVCARSLGPRLQIGTFAVSVFLLFCQPLFFMRAGGAVPDTTVATLVIVVVALYLARSARESPRGFEWQILLIGALTVWAVKSKELGVILFWLVVLFLFERGRLDWRGFRRKLGAWMVGALAGLALLMALDGFYFKDPLFGLRPKHQAEVRELNVAESPQQSRESQGWLDVVAGGKSPVAAHNARMRYMASLVVIAALLAAFKKGSIELRLLHFLPVLFVLMLMLLHVRTTYAFLARYLYPIVPLSCFLAAAGFHYLGIDELRWRDLASPRFFVPALLLGFLVFGIVMPYDTGWIEAGDFLPAAWLHSIDWTSLDAFVAYVAAPVLILTLVLALAFFQSVPARILIAVTLTLVFLGQPFYRTLWELGARRAWQRGEQNLHALRVFEDEIPEDLGAWIQIGPDLMNRHGMFGNKRTCERIVRGYLRRQDIKTTCWKTIVPEQDVAFLSRTEYKTWVDLWPELEQTATFSPGGEIVFARPSRTPNPPEIFGAAAAADP